MVWPTPQIVVGRTPYYACFKLLQDGRLQSSSLENNDNEWAKGIGLGEAVFLEAHRGLGRTVVSSRRWAREGGEWRTDRAQAMWERFRDEGLAVYDAPEDRFTFDPRSANAGACRLITD
jgi:hypothetical protein